MIRRNDRRERRISMRIRWKRLLPAVLCAALLVSALPAARAAGPEIDFLSYEEALTYFDFNNAASNWCMNFGMDPATRLEEARAAILAGTDRELIVRLATFARDTGHGEEKIGVTNAFRPACYQEVIGLHDSNTNTGPYRNAMNWNGRSLTGFWWTAESAPGWPEDYAIDLSAYDIATLSPRYFYRAALRLWDNTWVSAYYARPGCSAHNSGAAMDISNWWIAGSFATVFTVNGVRYDMADYGLYKPLQPSNGSAGETWHITCSPAVLALGNYDRAFDAGYETVYTLYYNPLSQGWTYADGRGVYLGAGVAVLQLRLCQLGLLDSEYITGFFCSRTEEALKAFQQLRGLTADGICGSGTMARLLETEPPAPDSSAPTLTTEGIRSAVAGGFTLSLRGEDDRGVCAFRVETCREGEDDWVSRYYNARRDGSGLLDIDVWEEGSYRVRAAALDAFGNESESIDCGTVFIDTTPPRLNALSVCHSAGDSLTLTLKATDNRALAGYTVRFLSDSGELRESFLLSDGAAEAVYTESGLAEGRWQITVIAADAAGNESGHTFSWIFESGTAPDGIRRIWYGPAKKTE